MVHTARQLWRSRGLLATLISRDLKARYRGSVLGYLWSLINPLLLLAVYSVVFGLVLTPPRGEGVSPYAVFLVTGLFPWIWFSSALLEGAASLLNNAGLIRKAVFPVELLPAVAVLANLIHFLFALPIMAGALVIGAAMGYSVGGWGALALPLVILIQLPLIGGLALALSSLTVYFKDLRDILTNFLTLAFFATPIIYPLSAVPAEIVRWGIRANPLTSYTLAYQDALFYGTFPGWELWLTMAVTSGLAWLAGTWVFDRLRETVVEAA